MNHTARIPLPEALQPRAALMVAKTAEWSQQAVAHGEPRAVTIQCIQPTCEGWKERIFELHLLESQVLSRPGPKGLQAVYSRSSRGGNLQPRYDLRDDLLARKRHVHGRDAPGVATEQESSAAVQHAVYISDQGCLC